MKKPNIAKLFHSARTALSKHSPEILMGIGIAGMITTTVLAVRATPKALRLIDEAKHEKEVDELPILETVKVAWKPYIPAALTGTASVVCLIGASSVHTRRTAAVAAAYQLSESAFAEYKEKVVETIGEKKEQAVREKISEDRVKQAPVSSGEVYVTNNGDTLFLEPISGRLFKSDIELVRRAVNNINERMLHDISGYASLSDWYDEINLDHTDMSDTMGWNTDAMLRIDFHPSMTKDMKPCIALYYEVPPKYGYDKFM